MGLCLNHSIEARQGGGLTMGGKPEWRWQLGLGLVLVLQSFTEWDAPLGPWQEESFTRGVIGLIGLGFIYIAKYRWQFETIGVIPYLQLYHCEKENIVKSAIFEALLGLLLIFILGYLSNIEIHVPGPAALIILLYSSLMVLHAIYAWLVISGPLTNDEEE